MFSSLSEQGFSSQLRVRNQPRHSALDLSRANQTQANWHRNKNHVRAHRATVADDHLLPVPLSQVQVRRTTGTVTVDAAKLDVSVNV
jgi:hypothetical protein